MPVWHCAKVQQATAAAQHFESDKHNLIYGNYF